MKRVVLCLALLFCVGVIGGCRVGSVRIEFGICAMCGSRHAPGIPCYPRYHPDEYPRPHYCPPDCPVPHRHYWR